MKLEAILIGIRTMALPYFVMQPAFGLGMAAFYLCALAASSFTLPL